MVTASEEDLLGAAVRVLADRLPSTWHVERRPPTGDPTEADLVVKSPHGEQTLLVEAMAAVSPRDVEALLGGP